MLRRRGTERSKPVQFLLSRLKSGKFVAFREAGAIPTEEAAVGAAGAAAPAGAEDEEVLLHSEEQARAQRALA